ncbi:mRNA 3'-end-processing protein rna14 [Elasticomyces elasticus]|uniref:mRNA 3'-end-processing protein RNA14 n=1 Tax=Exophiala sideris TaxID=1016849 RepID=A0ABR0JN73_9EURO|nr:mRNA 3'-end-processing protein rna14 [Elasticomyces elasticus]KAK5036367.1 mRNA 3'-end-processing protein rna14 [Exophiala sideris]KAK5041801.1 mRNA 3'-end-processing protein rna14 [Exophiala sideris]KAK5066751.1 mRNA 3'-end-processing protein rna14 [Exophiala sideris]KAK5184809.1 mRNA 3'-end-processing protein rna14 [Eurotiomycetes sp. CCFEE 6388]
MASSDQETLSPSAMAAQSAQFETSDAATAMTENSVAQPFSPSEQIPVDNMRDTILSPTQSALHPLPAKPIDQSSAPTPTPNMAQSSTPVPSQPQRQPRIVGGFEVDDDPDEEDVAQDEKDDADVYDPSVGLDFDAPTPAPANALDRTSQSPEQENGITPAPVQATGSLADISSFTVPTGGDATRAATATPAQTAPATPAQLSPPRSHVNGLVSAGLPKSRLAHDVIGILEDRIRDDPRGDTAAYLELIDELKSRNKQDDVRRVYEQYLTVFPFDAEQWCAYVKWEEEHDRLRAMETLFNRSLLEVLDVQLWTLYINYIRRRNNMHSGDIARSYNIINESFSFALKTIGMDKDSGSLWQDYINFLKSGPGTIGGTGWQDAGKVDTLREAYQKAIAVPTAATTVLWKEYDAFETGLSKINGRKYLQEKSPIYMTARTAYTQLQNLTRGLRRTSRPQLPPASGYEGYDDYMQQVALWKQWIEWEKEDNLVIKDEDLALYRNRILFTYKQALMALQFWPETWYDAVEFCFANGLDSDGIKLLNQGITSIPESPLLAFRLADRTETSTQNDEAADPGAKERMKKIREPYDKVLDSLYELIKKVSARETLEIQKVEVAAASNGEGDGGEDEINAANITAKKAVIDSQIEVIRKSAQAQTDMLSRMISHVWIALMRATRRVQGKGMPGEKGPSGFRIIFGEARKRGKLTSEFYVESARIEWQCYRDPAGTKILDRGMKLFPEDDYLPLQYIKHLFEINDVTNARAVFETTVKRLLAHDDVEHTAKAKPLFAFLHDYESKYGELAQVQSLEERMRKHFPEDPSLKLFSSRYSTTTFDTISAHPVISPSQMQPAQNSVLPSVEVPEMVNSPIQKVIDSITTNSPKRPFPDDFEDGGPRKLARGESPLKGAAGRRMNQQQQQRLPPPPAGMPNFPVPPPFPPQITYLLSILPKASTYVDARLDAAKMVELIRDVHLPPPTAIAQHAPPPAPVSGSGWSPYGQQPPASMPPQGFVPPPGVTQAQYGGAPFRYA